jgi:hypothetical protein
MDPKTCKLCPWLLGFLKSLVPQNGRGVPPGYQTPAHYLSSMTKPLTIGALIERIRDLPGREAAATNELLHELQREAAAAGHSSEVS